MRLVQVSREAATLELSMEEVGLVLNALWQDLGYQEPRPGDLDPDLRSAYDALQRAFVNVTAAMDASSS
jgi:hypothetical protein